MADNTIRGKAVIVGIGETAHRRVWPNRSMLGLCAEAAAEAIRDAGLRREDIDGIMTYGADPGPTQMAEYLGLNAIHFGVGSTFYGASAGCALTIASHVLMGGMANYIMFVGGGSRDPGNPAAAGGTHMNDNTPALPPPSITAEWQNPYGPAIAANNNYGMLYARHMYEYGTKPEQIAQIAARQRFNAQANERSAFLGQPITTEDVMNSRYINYPLHILESVMPTAGAIAYIVTTPERARTLKHDPVYVLGAGLSVGYAMTYMKPIMTESPVRYSAAAALQMAGYAPKDMQFANFYDCYTILNAVSLEDAGLCPKGEIGNWLDSIDSTYKGDFPLNTDGGQLGVGQLNAAGASGCQQIVETVRQIRGEAGQRQVPRHDIALVNG